jgi:hypothetical protein
MKKAKRKFVQFVERLHGKRQAQRLAIIDNRMEKLRAEGGNRKKLRRLAVLRGYLAAAGQIAKRMPQSRVVSPAVACPGSRIQLGA